MGETGTPFGATRQCWNGPQHSDEDASAGRVYQSKASSVNCLMWLSSGHSEDANRTRQGGASPCRYQPSLTALTRTMSYAYWQTRLNDYEAQDADGAQPPTITSGDIDADVIPTNEIVGSYLHRGDRRYRKLVESQVDNNEYVLLEDTKNKFANLETVTTTDEYVIAVRDVDGYREQVRFTLDDLRSGPNEPESLVECSEVRSVIEYESDAITIIHPMAMMIERRDRDPYVVVIECCDDGEADR